MRNIALAGTIAATTIGVGLLVTDRMMGGEDPGEVDSHTTAGQTVNVETSGSGILPAGTAVVDTRTGKTLGSNPGNPPTETPTPTVEAKKEAPFPYKLAEGSEVEYKGPQLTVKFGVEEALANRPEDHKTTVNGRELNSPPIRKVELSNTDINTIATDKFPNGMSQEEMVQRLNDAVLIGMLPFVNNMPEYANSKLDIEGLKDIVDQGKEVKFRHPLVEGGKPIDLSKGVSIIFIDQRDDNGIANAPGTTSYVYKEHNGQIVIGIWNAYSYNFGSRTTPEYQIGYDVSAGVALGVAADPTAIGQNTRDVLKEIAPYVSTKKGSDGWFPVAGTVGIKNK